MANESLPIFPLQVVLLPEEILPLHIFEERYKQMIGECLEGNLPFGVILAEESGIRRIGCTAHITEVTQKFPDGRMNIATEGKSRFHILQTHEDKPYLTAEVNFFEDAGEEPPPAALLNELVQAFQAEGIETDFQGENLIQEPARLSFNIGAALKLPLRDKQTLLESNSIEERLRALLKWIGEKKNHAESISRQQEKATQNGHPQKPGS